MLGVEEVDELSEGYRCSLSAAICRLFSVLAPATSGQGAWPMHGWRTPRFRDVGWASWKGGRDGVT